ncbi:cupin [Clostridium polyendosporum]|uniref:Cupin n=1 Tax=Clostridium polyendosporum TaxID=69208 RepID=A0A919VNM4_9CLOT|nr:cupin domain-containing protein [Clostridium polyendosporum]GIM30678.1 cupin [Clostridium polyendosporum]
MYNDYETYPYPCPYCVNTPRYNSDVMYNAYRAYPCPYCANTPMYNPYFSNQFTNQHIPFTSEMEYDSRFDFWESPKDGCIIQLMDYGPEPFVVNIEEATKQNDAFRTVLWTGSHLQLTLMSINVGEDIGLEIHPDIDQFIRIEEGQGLVKMGDRKDKLDFQEKVYDDFAFIIPAGKWHNIINTGNKPLKLYSIYAPPQHPLGTVHATKAIAEAAE